MDSDKYRRGVSLNCPTCGGTDFEVTDEELQSVTCARCGHSMTRDELIRENSENISEHVEEVKAEIVKDLKKVIHDSLRKGFRGSKNIRIK